MARPRSDIRARILHAARDRFLTDGVDGASLRSVATDAKTSIGMVYYYFPTKDELFLGVLEEVYERILGDLTLALDPTLPAPERIRRLYRRIASATPEELTVFRLILREALVSSSRLEQVVARFQRGHLPLIVRLLGDAMQTGTFDPKIPPAVLAATMMALGGAGQFLARFVEARMPFPASPSAIPSWEQMLDILLHGVSPKPEQERSP